MYDICSRQFLQVDLSTLRRAVNASQYSTPHREHPFTILHLGRNFLALPWMPPVVAPCSGSWRPLLGQPRHWHVKVAGIGVQLLESWFFMLVISYTYTYIIIHLYNCGAVSKTWCPRSRGWPCKGPFGRLKLDFPGTCRCRQQVKAGGGGVQRAGVGGGAGALSTLRCEFILVFE